MPDYPLSIVWMIECRHWHDDDDIKQGEPIEPGKAWMRYAPVEPSGFGSGVVVQLEQLGNDDQTLKPPSIKNYLLTCGHVIRAGSTGTGAVVKEIICWKPGKGYYRTLQFNATTNEGRLKGQMEGGYLATISPLSPYDGRLDAIPEAEFEPHLDWALLDVGDLPDRPVFDAEPTLKEGFDAIVDSKVRFMGYPNGAGWESERDSWKVGGHYWSNGEPVEPFLSDEESITRVEDKMIEYRGAVEVRPGMSGGGVFQTSDNALVGLHRSRNDAALKAVSLSFADIMEWLRTHRHVRPVYFKTAPPPPRRRWLIPIAVAVMAIVSVIVYHACQPDPDEPTTYVWRGRVEEVVSEGGLQIKKPINGATVMPYLNNADLTELQITTPSPSDLGPGEFEIKTTNPLHYSDAVMIKISKKGYKTVVEDAQAVKPRTDGKHHVVYRLTKQTTP